MKKIAKILSGSMLASMLMLTGCSVSTHSTTSNVTETTDENGVTTTVTEETVDGQTTTNTVVTDKDGKIVEEDGVKKFDKPIVFVNETGMDITGITVDYKNSEKEFSDSIFTPEEMVLETGYNYKIDSYVFTEDAKINVHMIDQDGKEHLFEDYELKDLSNCEKVMVLFTVDEDGSLICTVQG